MGVSKPLSLRRNFSWTFIGNAVYAACQWGMLMIMAKLGSPEMVGQFTLGLAVTAPVFMFTNLQLRHIQATDATHQYYFGDYFGLRIIATTLGLIAIIFISLLGGYNHKTLLIILFVGLAKAFESISDVLYGLIQQHERMDRIAVSLMIKGPLSIFMLGLGLYFSKNLFWGVFGLALSWAVVLIWYDFPSGKLILKDSTYAIPVTEYGVGKQDVKLRPYWNLKTLKKLVWLSLPLGFVMLLISLNINIPRYFIERYLGQRELGFFAAIAYLMMVGSMIVNALGQSASPRLARYYATKNIKSFQQLLTKLVVIGALLSSLVVLIAIFAGPEILTLLYKPEYAQHNDLFVWLMIAAGINYIAYFLGYGMTAARYFRIQMPLFMIATATSALGSLLLIPIFQLKGAAIALVLSAIVEAILCLGVISHALRKIQ